MSTKTKTKPKKKASATRVGTNKKTAGKKAPKGYMNMILIGILMSLSIFSYAQLGVLPCAGPGGLQVSAGAIQPGDYQAVNLPTAGKFNAISVTTYTNQGTQYTPNRHTYSNVEWYYLAYADTAGVPTTPPSTITYPIYLYLCQPGQVATLQNYPTTSALGGTSTSTVKFDTTYTFTYPLNGDSTQVDSVVFHLGKKYNYESRTVIVNGADGINDKNVGGANQYLHKARVPLVPQVPVY